MLTLLALANSASSGTSYHHIIAGAIHVCANFQGPEHAYAAPPASVFSQAAQQALARSRTRRM